MVNRANIYRKLQVIHGAQVVELLKLYRQINLPPYIPQAIITHQKASRL